MAHRLADAPSPYLRQHAGNPVDWWPWGEEAFAQARRRDVPVFLSVGYATCHWCHVMAHESFEDDEVAAALNDAFVCIKVDREERPDVDDLYMAYCQATAGRGGWPLTVLLTPDREPFFAGTYLPKRSRGPMMGLLDLLPRVAAAWRERREELVNASRHALSHLAHVPDAGDDLPPAALDACTDALRARFDAEFAGFGRAPKFPSPHNLLYLLRRHHATGGDDLLEMVLRTLRAMTDGGLHDHLGGGFHRYSTDRAWVLPHFEKMLYDQAMIALACTEAWEATRLPWLADTTRDALDYVLRDLADPAGGFRCAEDADSEGEEGRFYVWTWGEVVKALAEDAPLFAAAYDVRKGGNHDDEATGRPTGRNVLRRVLPDAELGQRFGLRPDEVRDRLTRCREALRVARDRRPRPLLDDKVITDWNGLSVAAFARAGRVLGEPRYVDAALGAIDFLRQTMRTPGGRLRHRYHDGAVDDAAFLDDHAYLLWGLLEAYEAAFRPMDLAWARRLADDLETHFAASNGAYAHAPDDPGLPARRVEGTDGALPGGNAAAAWSLHRLSLLTGEPVYGELARRILRAFSPVATEAPQAFVGLHLSLDALTGPSSELLVVGEDRAAAALLAVAGEAYRPHLRVLRSRPGLDKVAPWTAAMPSGPHEAARAYLCVDHACRQPVEDPDALRDLLA